LDKAELLTQYLKR